MLPTHPTAAELDALQGNPQAWLPSITALAALHGGGPVQPMGESTVLVALLGSRRVLKLYPPFLRDHWVFERATLQHLQRWHNALGVPTPPLLASGEHEGWPYLLMGQLPGTQLLQAWPALGELHRCQVLHQIGQLAAQVHALPLGDLPAQAQAPEWAVFINQQRSRCHARQQRTGLPAHLLGQLAAFLQGDVPGLSTGPAVLLTGEYTPMNLLVQRPTEADAGADAGAGDVKLSGMFDFGDGLVGPAAYDWLGPLCFLAAGNAARCQAFFGGYGAVLDSSLRLQLLRLLLLHRYSHLPAQIAAPGWQRCGSFEALAAFIWPLT
jgi:hygromycin-B 7''-O-kinase